MLGTFLVAAVAVLAVVVTLILSQGKDVAANAAYTGDPVTVADVEKPSTATTGTGGVPVGAEGVAGEEPGEDAVVVDPQYPEPLRGRAAIERDIADFLRAFPDLGMEVTRTVVDGTVTRLRRSATDHHHQANPRPANAIAADSPPRPAPMMPTRRPRESAE